MLHIHFWPIESSTPRPLMTEQLPLPFEPTGMEKILHVGLSTRVLAAVLTGQRLSHQPRQPTFAEIRHRMNTRAIRKALALESGVAHG